MILHHENLDYAKHCSIPFGTYVQAHTEPSPSNTQDPRTLDCLYMRFTNNSQGGHELLDLCTGALINHCTITPVPLTQNIIDLVHAMATREGMPDGLKIKTKGGVTIYDSAWIAGVDYDPNEIEDEDKEYIDKEDNEEEDDEEDYDPIDPNELAEIIQEMDEMEEEQEENEIEDQVEEQQEANPIEVEEYEIEEEQEEQEEDEQEEEESDV